MDDFAVIVITKKLQILRITSTNFSEIVCALHYFIVVQSGVSRAFTEALRSHILGLSTRSDLWYNDRGI